jgi:hypothetical protein
MLTLHYRPITPPNGSREVDPSPPPTLKGDPEWVEWWHVFWRALPVCCRSVDKNVPCNESRDTTELVRTLLAHGADPSVIAEEPFSTLEGPDKTAGDYPKVGNQAWCSAALWGKLRVALNVTQKCRPPRPRRRMAERKEDDFLPEEELIETMLHELTHNPVFRSPGNRGLRGSTADGNHGRNSGWGNCGRRDSWCACGRILRSVYNPLRCAFIANVLETQ